MKSVIVVGGGAGGLMSSIIAARFGATVTLLEKNDRVGKKILVTGNGRCNYTNLNIEPEHFHGTHPEFAMKAIQLFDQNQTIRFFEELGIIPFTGERGRVFPYSQQAASVLDALRFEAERLQVKTITGADISTLIKSKDQFDCITRQGVSCQSDALILACGGKSQATTGSNGEGLKLAKTFKHTYIEPAPALSQLSLEGTGHKAMEGMKWECAVSILHQDKTVAQAQGDIIFTDYGLSGLAVLSVSRKALELVRKEGRAVLSIDIFPEWPPEKIFQTIRERIRTHPSWPLENLFIGWLNKRIGMTLLKTLGFKMNQPLSSLSDTDGNQIAARLKNFTHTVTGDNGWNNAQVTSGGISTAEINPDTMESKLCKGLFFAGEMIDIDGDSGGYNLQWAWSSGYLAGKFTAR